MIRINKLPIIKQIEILENFFEVESSFIKKIRYITYNEIRQKTISSIIIKPRNFIAVVIPKLFAKLKVSIEVVGIFKKPIN
ncbi:unnamed protein product [marine sediment metagenome]|uniref:Uncharacterized protein n=1 Tax=marine sediment metagenome TaxID=412755 RepID=X1BDX9_9ZZZZ